MTPVVNGKTYHFAVRGFFEGVMLLGDRESNSYWNYISGHCVHGPLKGNRLETYPLLYMTAAQALATYPEAQLAMPNIRRQAYLPLVYFLKSHVKKLLPSSVRKRMAKRFLWLLAPIDFIVTNPLGEATSHCRPLEMGLGVWSNATHRFYPLETLRMHRGALIDKFEGRRLLVYIEPVCGVPIALYTEATQCVWQADALHLSTGELIRGASLYDQQDRTQVAVQPMQLFTRSHGFASTFPDCEVYGGGHPSDTTSRSRCD